MPNDPGTLVIRADAGLSVGTGHLMRCIALAQCWADQGGNAIFITYCESGHLLTGIADEGFQVVRLHEIYPNPTDWETTTKILKVYPDAWVILDGYHFDTDYQYRIKDAGHPLLVIDDYGHATHYYADIVLNQNLGAHRELYQNHAPTTKLLMGPEYALLRREFRLWGRQDRDVPEVGRRILVTIGGADPHNVTLEIMKVLEGIDTSDLETVIVAGAANPHYGELQERASISRHAMRVLRSVTDMPRLMACADMCISGAGSTCWELLCMGVPSILIVVADNQKRAAEALSKSGATMCIQDSAHFLRDALQQAVTDILTDHDRRQSMNSLGRGIVDGQGAVRVCSALRGQ